MAHIKINLIGSLVRVFENQKVLHHSTPLYYTRMVVITLMFSRQLDTEAATVLINTKESGLTSQPIWGQRGGDIEITGDEGQKKERQKKRGGERKEEGKE